MGMPVHSGQRQRLAFMVKLVRHRVQDQPPLRQGRRLVQRPVPAERLVERPEGRECLVRGRVYRGERFAQARNVIDTHLDLGVPQADAARPPEVGVGDVRVDGPQATVGEAVVLPGEDVGGRGSSQSRTPARVRRVRS